ncbi:MAG: Hsp70 family protein [Pseudolysinimonas sp.]|uniref:Hsp70 family protein n=1 Tax=Pseudolysinimonas sp. TaxID=2680009 RepID=UPI003264860B
MPVGFDFGTTNSLISVVSGDRVVDVLDSEGRPHPSVVRYEGERVVVGREARNELEAVGLGVHGNTVRSPKVFLGDDVVEVGGVEMNPVDVVADVLKHVKAESLKSRQAERLDGVQSAVVTIPVTMDGRRRRALREAYALAGISVAQFVHEPLAALYGYLRGAVDSEDLRRRFARRNVLVVDWGGGTLDLTLCRVEAARILQLRNGGTDQVGGDRFDEVIQSEVVRRFSLANGIGPTDQPSLDSRLRLRQDAENNKIELSQRGSISFYRPAYFPESGATLEYELARSELEEVVRPLISAGMSEIDSLLSSVGFAAAQVSHVVVVGGMAAMPAIRSHLYEMFGPERVHVPDNSATLVSQGAAWIAHDAQRLVLAKPIELELARGDYLPLLKAGDAMPTNREITRNRVHLYCADPSDGIAKFAFVSPTELREHPQASSRRTTLGVVTVRVDKKAPPLTERLELEVKIDDDLVLEVTATSAQEGDSDSADYYDLEFGLGLGENGLAYSVVEGESAGERATASATGLAMRVNLAQNAADQDAVPGDVLYLHRPSAFSPPPMPGPLATNAQKQEHLYYRPCSVCKRQWGDPECRCAA